MSQLKELKLNLHPGKVYKLSDLEELLSYDNLSLEQLEKENVLDKLSDELFHYPKKTVFGSTPPDDEDFLRAFLDDEEFLVTSYNAYNSLGVGTTQLYNETLVYNRKKNEKVELNGRNFNCKIKSNIPDELSAEFLLVDLVDNLEKLAEDTKTILEKVKVKASSMNSSVLSEYVKSYGEANSKHFFAEVLEDKALCCAA